MLTNPQKFIESLLFRVGLFLPDKLFLKVWYHNRMGYWMDFNNPQTFNEKLQWLKLYNRKHIYTTMVDKYAVKKYVADIIGDEHIIPNLGVWKNFNDIDFKKLPNQFVLKCTHDSGGIVICKDKSKFDITTAKKKIEQSLKTDFYKLGREWPYKNVPKLIMAEKYMVDKKTEELRDYKFFCFNGIVKFFKIDFDRFTNHRANYYSLDGELQQFGEVMCPPDFSRELEMPKNLLKMINLAEKLSLGIPFLRVDFYEVDSIVYFGEMTFFPNSGQCKFTKDKWDFRLGQMINLDKI